VLELSKIEAGRVSLQLESFDLYDLLDGLEEMFRLRATEKGLMLIFDRAPDVPRYVRADQGKLRQVIMNVLGNAVKYTQEGGVTLRVKCVDLAAERAAESDQESPVSLLSAPRCVLCFQVEDTGPGIAPEEQVAVFDPFRQTSTGRGSQEGTGLGMPISRQFVRMMGGDLTFCSDLAVGTVFEFDVPIEVAQAADVSTSRPKGRVIGLAPGQCAADGGPYRLLVVEDREANRKLLVKLLSDLNPPDLVTRPGGGFEVRGAANGQEAIEVWERWKPHLIWMDMRMPVMDGHEATQRIKATAEGQATVIIALTASAFVEDREMILSEGCDDYVRKPFREQEVLDMLTKYLGVRFVYEDIAEEEAAEGALSSAALAALPTDWVVRLRQAAIQADADIVLGLLDQIREQDAPLVATLMSLVRDFRFDTIAAWAGFARDGDEKQGD
jgi:CheY-like chemotaxis protein